MRPASLISSKMIEREVNQDSDTRFTIRLIESTRNSLPARGLRFPNLDRFNRPIVFRLNATVDPFFRPAGYIRSKGSFRRSISTLCSSRDHRGGQRSPRLRSSSPSWTTTSTIGDRSNNGVADASVSAIVELPAIIIRPSDFWIRCNR